MPVVEMSKVEVGFLDEGEIDRLISLADEIWHNTYKDILSEAQIAYMLALIYAADRLRTQVDAGHPIFVARVGLELVGYTHVLIEGHHSKLDKLYVAADLQGHGVGRLLLETAERFARDCMCSVMSLQVHKNNHKAIQAYGKFGFEVVSTYKEDIGAGFVMDDFIMIKELPLVD